MIFSFLKASIIFQKIHMDFTSSCLMFKLIEVPYCVVLGRMEEDGKFPASQL